MCRNPVKDHADPMLMHIVHKIHKILRSAISRSRRIITGHLVSPGAVKRMLHHRHQLNMRIPHFGYILRKHHRKLTVIVKTAVLLLRLFERAKMDFID